MKIKKKEVPSDDDDVFFGELKESIKEAEPSKENTKEEVEPKSAIRVLVTGAEGLFGRNIIPYLKENGIEVDSYDIKTGDDIFDREKLSKRISSCDVIVHLVTYPHFDPYIPWEEYSRLNIDGAKAVLLIAEEKKKRFIYFSSGAIYGFDGGFAQPDGNALVVDWHGEMESMNKYARSKVIAEEFIREAPGSTTRIILRPNWPGLCPNADLLAQHWFAEVTWDLVNEVTLRSIVYPLSGIHTFNLVNSFQRNGEPSLVAVENRISELGI